MLPESRGSNYIQRVASVYGDLFKDKYGFFPTINFGRLGKLLKIQIETHTELQIAALLIVFFNWAGMDGGDNFARDRLISSGHAFGWFFNNPNQYEIYLRNVHKLNFENEDEVRNYVGKSLLALKKS